MRKLTLLVISIATVFASCKKDKSDDPASTNNDVTINSTAQVSFKLDGTTKSYVQSATIEQSIGSSKSIATWPDTSSGSWSCGFDDPNSGDDIFDISKGYLRFLGANPDTTVFYNFFVPGNSSYVNNPDIQMGVELYYFIGGVKWSTELGSGLQTGSSFKITDRKKVWLPTGDRGITVLINFNCILYDGNGNSKTVTDGVFLGTYMDI
ncbi:MAG: hypothetical protein ABI723_14915 [Bacteroidia bacterium]